MQHKKIASRDPEWYATMIFVARDEGWEIDEFNKLFDEAIARYPRYYSIYFAATEYLMPKWHGSIKELEEFANKAVLVADKRDKDAMYARVYKYIAEIHYGSTLFVETDVNWQRMSISFDSIVQQYPDQWNINSFAYFACYARDAKKTHQMIQRIKGKPMMEIWNDQMVFDVCQEYSVNKSMGWRSVKRQ